jgi:hypothetical protein
MAQQEAAGSNMLTKAQKQNLARREKKQQQAAMKDTGAAGSTNSIPAAKTAEQCSSGAWDTFFPAAARVRGPGNRFALLGDTRAAAQVNRTGSATGMQHTVPGGSLDVYDEQSNEPALAEGIKASLMQCNYEQEMHKQRAVVAGGFSRPQASSSALDSMPQHSTAQHTTGVQQLQALHRCHTS